MKWFRFYAEALHDVKVQSLPPPLFKAWVNLLCVAASDERGMIPKSALAVGFQLRIPTAKADKILRQLIDADLLEDNETGDLRPHNWNGRQFASDNVTERVRKHRKGVTGNVSETPRARADSEAEESRGDTDSETEAEAEDFRRCCKAFEDCIGTVDAHTAKRITDAIEDYGATCVIHCLEEAADLNKRSWRYAETIMQRHKTEGCYDDEPEAETWEPKPVDLEAERLMREEADRFKEQMAKEFPAILGTTSSDTIRAGG